MGPVATPEDSYEGAVKKMQKAMAMDGEINAAAAEAAANSLAGDMAKRQMAEAKEMEESNRDKEQMLEKQVKARVQQWTKEKKHLRALLASLHEIAPPCSWKHSISTLK